MNHTNKYLEEQAQGRSYMAILAIVLAAGVVIGNCIF
jgi:hypothetical protein